MDRVKLLAVASLRNLDALYFVRGKVHAVALLLASRPSEAAQVASEFSDFGRLLFSLSRPIEVHFSLEEMASGLALCMDFHFETDVEQPQRLAQWAALGTVQRTGSAWLVRKVYRFRGQRLLDADLPQWAQILQAKTREELFDDLNLKNELLQSEIEERKATEHSLRKAQEDLIASEKLAALGGLVAGIAHEINTPVGIGVTAASHLSETIRDFLLIYRDGNMRRSDLEKFLQAIEELNLMVEENLQRASRLIGSFKEVAVDQTADDVREIVLRDYAEQVITSLSPKLRNRPVKVFVDGIDPSIVLSTSPGPISQILTNLIVNSLVHAFDVEQQGTIRIAARKTGTDLAMTYSDNGKGIAPEHLKKIFDPFFTTKRAHGGSGLGMHLVYNIVTKKYMGKIRCESELGQGVTFEILFPNMLRG